MHICTFYEDICVLLSSLVIITLCEIPLYFRSWFISQSGRGVWSGGVSDGDGQREQALCLQVFQWEILESHLKRSHPVLCFNQVRSIHYTWRPRNRVEKPISQFVSQRLLADWTIWQKELIKATGNANRTDCLVEMFVWSSVYSSFKLYINSCGNDFKVIISSLDLPITCFLFF